MDGSFQEHLVTAVKKRRLHHSTIVEVDVRQVKGD